MILDYCRSLFATLQSLETLLQDVREVSEDYKRRVNRQIERQANFMGVFLSISLIIWFMTDQSGIFGELASGINPLDVFLRMFAVTFIALVFGNGIRFFFSFLWKKNYLPCGRKHLFQLFRKRYLSRKKEINQKIKIILDSELIQDVKIPCEYLNTQSLNYMINCLEAGEVSSLEEAMSLLELDSRDIQVHDLITVSEDIIIKAQQMINEDEELCS